MCHLVFFFCDFVRLGRLGLGLDSKTLKTRHNTDIGLVTIQDAEF